MLGPRHTRLRRCWADRPVTADRLLTVKPEQNFPWRCLPRVVSRRTGAPGLGHCSYVTRMRCPIRRRPIHGLLNIFSPTGTEVCRWLKGQDDRPMSFGAIYRPSPGPTTSLRKLPTTGYRKATYRSLSQFWCRRGYAGVHPIHGGDSWQVRLDEASVGRRRKPAAAVRRCPRAGDGRWTREVT